MSGIPNRAFSVYVGPVPAEITEDELKSHFSSCGFIEDIKICVGKGPNMKFAFVRFSNENAAIEASRLHGTIHIGKYTPRINYDAVKNKLGPKPVSSRSFSDEGFNKPDIVPYNGGGFKPKDSSGPIREEILVMSHVESPTSFWGQQSQKAGELKDLSDALNAVCVSAQPVTGQPSMSKIYACKYSADESWYRCRLKSYKSMKESEVLYLDFGNSEVVENSCICELPATLTAFKPIASRYMLYGLKPIHHDPKSLGFDQGCQKLQELTEAKILQVKIQANINGDLAVIVDADGVDVNQEILNENFAVRRGQSHSQPPQNADVPCSNSQWNETTPKTQPQASTWGAAGASSANRFRNNSDEAALAKGEADRLRRELDAVKQERDHILLELSTSKGSVQTLKQEQMLILQQLQETSLSSKVKGLMVNVTKIRALRTQFPTDGETADGIEQALLVVQQSKGVVLEAGNQAACRVFDKCNMYQRAQEAIKACSSQVGLSDLMACRNQCRRMLCTAIEEFLATTVDLPLDEQSQHLNQVLVNLTSTYNNFLELPADEVPLADAIPLYSAWRSQKKTEFQEVRTKTNTTHNTLAGALIALQKLLCIDDSMADEVPSNVNTLDNLFQEFNSCLAEEIHFTDVQQESDPVSLINILLKALVKDIQGQLKEIVQLQQLSHKNKELLSNLQPWLEKQPCVDDLLAIRKTIKGIKSKLRHRLADLQDIEEDNSDEDVDQLESLTKEVTSLRGDLQAAFKQEGKALEALAELADHHFPELLLQHPDLKLKDEISYCSLLKDGWSLDHFDKQPAKELLPAILSSYCGSPVILKECILDENMGVNSQAFLHNAVSYKSSASPYLVPVDSIFFLKSDRHAFVMLPHYKVSLRQMVLAEGQLSSLAVYELLWGVLQGLYALHSNGIVHGALHPSNIFVTEKGGSVLGDFDFSKSLKQRVSLCVQTFDGLSFRAPEALTAADTLSKAADMYCFGLLILWLVYHQDAFPTTTDGAPDLQALRLEEPTGGLIRNLLSTAPAQRLTSANLILSPLFQKKPHVVDAEATTLQLRPPKTPSPPVGSRPPGSILKNGSPALSPPISEPIVIEEKDFEEDTKKPSEDIAEEEEINEEEEEEEAKVVEEEEEQEQEVEVIKEEVEVNEVTESGDTPTEPSDQSHDDLVPDELNLAEDELNLAEDELSLAEMLEDVANLDEIPPPLEYCSNE